MAQWPVLDSLYRFISNQSHLSEICLQPITDSLLTVIRIIMDGSNHLSSVKLSKIILYFGKSLPSSHLISSS